MANRNRWLGGRADCVRMVALSGEAFVEVMHAGPRGRRLLREIDGEVQRDPNFGQQVGTRLFKRRLVNAKLRMTEDVGKSVQPSICESGGVESLSRAIAPHIGECDVGSTAYASERKSSTCAEQQIADVHSHGGPPSRCASKDDGDPFAAVALDEGDERQFGGTLDAARAAIARPSAPLAPHHRQRLQK